MKAKYNLPIVDGFNVIEELESLVDSIAEGLNKKNKKRGVKNNEHQRVSH